MLESKGVSGCQAQVWRHSQPPLSRDALCAVQLNDGKTIEADSLTQTELAVILQGPVSRRRARPWV